MDAAAILLALLVAGVNFGWQPAGDGSEGLEYIVQVEPELLDALRRGEGVPIESNVPPDVGPIRKVSIVVGRDEVPRKSLGAVNHTAYFADQGSSLPGQSNPASAATQSKYDLYAAPPNVSASGISPPPSVLDRAQTAATETANTLQDGIEAGIQAANQQIYRTSEQAIDSTRNASQQFGQKLQEIAMNPAQQFESAGNSLRNSTEQTVGTIGNQLQQMSNPFTNSNTQSPANVRAQSNISPPPGYTTSPSGGTDLYGGSQASQTVNGAAQFGGSAPVQTPTGWTSIGSNVAAPPLIVPQMSTAPNRDVGSSARMASNDGPGFPSTNPGQAAGGFSENANQSRAQAQDAADNWANGGSMYSNNSTPEIGRGGAPAITRQGLDSNLVSVEPIPGSSPDPQQPASQPFDYWNGKDPFAQQRQMAGTDSGFSTDRAGTADATRTGATEWIGGSSPSMQGSNYPHSQPGQSQNGNFASQSNTGPGILNENERNRLALQTADGPATTSTAAEPPWMPFVLVCLTLVGSLSANLFLGWSYLDARQRYRLLVRKTAETFRRVASPAA